MKRHWVEGCKRKKKKKKKKKKGNTYWIWGQKFTINISAYQGGFSHINISKDYNFQVSK